VCLECIKWALCLLGIFPTAFVLYTHGPSTMTGAVIKDGPSTMTGALIKDAN
jgi:hypothetical protein